MTYICSIFLKHDTNHSWTPCRITRIFQNVSAGYSVGTFASLGWNRVPSAFTFPNKNFIQTHLSTFHPSLHPKMTFAKISHKMNLSEYPFKTSPPPPKKKKKRKKEKKRHSVREYLFFFFFFFFFFNSPVLRNGGRRKDIHNGPPNLPLKITSTWFCAPNIHGESTIHDKSNAKVMERKEWIKVKSSKT